MNNNYQETFCFVLGTDTRFGLQESDSKQLNTQESVASSFLLV